MKGVKNIETLDAALASGEIASIRDINGLLGSQEIQDLGLAALIGGAVGIGLPFLMAYLPKTFKSTEPGAGPSDTVRPAWYTWLLRIAPAATGLVGGYFLMDEYPTYGVAVAVAGCTLSAVAVYDGVIAKEEDTWSNQQKGELQGLRAVRVQNPTFQRQLAGTRVEVPPSFQGLHAGTRRTSRRGALVL